MKFKLVFRKNSLASSYEKNLGEVECEISKVKNKIDRFLDEIYDYSIIHSRDLGVSEEEWKENFNKLEKQLNPLGAEKVSELFKRTEKLIDVMCPVLSGGEFMIIP